MNIAYFGTPEISASLLENLLIHEVSISYVVTQPDKPVGKRLTLTPSPVKLVSQKRNIPFFDTKLNSSTSAKLMDTLNALGIELCILFAFGELIRTDLLKTPKHGFWNIHPSLLPLYRGASPTTYPLLLGEQVSGVTLMQMNEKLDEGDILNQKQLTLDSNITRDELENRSVQTATALILQGLDDMSTNKLHRKTQLHSDATYTRKISRADGFIEQTLLQRALDGDPRFDQAPTVFEDYYKVNTSIVKKEWRPADIVDRMYRAFTPWPGIWTRAVIKGVERRIKIPKLHLEGNRIIIDNIQIEGKPTTDFQTFKKAYTIFREKS